jgi:ABC-type nitrate/sulfonate/bicarbonate transport system permease component
VSTRRWVPGVIGVCTLIIAWALVSTTVLTARDGVPTPWATLRSLVHDGWSFYWPNLSQTGSVALTGYLVGNGLAIGCALLVLLVPILEGFILSMATASYCLPIMAIGPLLTLLFAGDTPMVVLSALSVFFTTLVGLLVGLRSVSRTELDLVRAYGGGRWQQMLRVRAKAALPSTLAALRVAAPAALLGAVIGEYLGRVTDGLGVAMIVSEQQLDVARTWAIALVCGALAGAGYALTALVERLAVPWARESGTGGGFR